MMVILSTFWMRSGRARGLGILPAWLLSFSAPFFFSIYTQQPSDQRYAFNVTWYDPAASLQRQYQLIYYASDGTLEMVRWAARVVGHRYRSKVVLTKYRAKAASRRLTVVEVAAVASPAPPPPHRRP